MISMSDHLYFSDLLKIVMESQLNDRIVNVGLDLNTESIFDILTSQYILVPIAFLILRKIWRLFIRGTGF